MGDISLKDLNKQINTFKNLPEVENVWIQDSALFVKFKNAGVIEWYLANNFIIPPYGKKKALASISNRKPVGNTKACLINQQFNDENRQYCRDIISDLQSSFQTAGYEVNVVNGSDANLNFFENSLNQYGAIFYISHGMYDGTRTWICSGQEPPDPKNKLDELFKDLYLWWVDGKISMASCKETRNGEKVPVSFYTFSDKFVSDTYDSKSFPNSLIYLVACQSFKGTNQLAAAFNNKGAGVTIGWDETNCLGQGTGKLLFDLLLSGASVESAFQTLPEASKLDYCSVSTGARLTYFPSEGKDICLVDTTDLDIVISYPMAGGSCTERVLNLSGYVTGAKKILSGVVEINSIPTTLTFSGNYFEQPVVINNGANKIKVICFGEMNNGKTGYGVKEINVVGDIPILDLFTELRWNTDYSDVDFHLLPPGSGLSELWTYKDCFYYNKGTTWGGYLDVDDVDGYGPEHITIPQSKLNGKYRLFVHYYDEQGAGTTSAFVSVSVKNGLFHNFGPYSLVNSGGDSSGDLYEVCTIEYPLGTITPVNKYYNLGKKKSSFMPPKKEQKNAFYLLNSPSRK
ncbi:MAG: hypothetical protein Q7U54_07485 [Bacteroidales bacterium]|nr:hypothetical protein [Bacteroidales bacterium]